MTPKSRSHPPTKTAQGPGFSARPTLRIDLSAIKANYLALQEQAPKALVAAAVKADAYGLGAERVGKTLYGAGCRNFFVATAGEGQTLRQAIGDNASIYMLNGPAPRDLALIFKARLKPVINSLIQARIWADAARQAKSPPFCAINIDTGMNRLGFSLDELEKLSKNKSLLENLQHDLIMSHLACAPDATHPMNAQQLARFKKAAARFSIKPMSLANTAGIYLGSQYHFQMVRPGIGLYGGIATTQPKQETVQPVISLMAPILQIRHLMPGETIGYDATYSAPSARKIAIVGAGYADGIPISSSSNGQTPHSFATLARQRAPIVGRVSMDLTALDVTDLKKTPRIGDWAEFRGIALSEDAKDAGTIHYELLVRLSQRSRREYR